MKLDNKYLIDFERVNKIIKHWNKDKEFRVSNIIESEDMLKELFDKIVNILENDSGEERRINIKKIWNGLSENDCNLFADYLKKIPYKNKKN